MKEGPELFRIKNLQVPFDDERSLKELAAERMELSPQAVEEVAVVRRAVDARRYHGAPIQFVYMLDVQVRDLGKKAASRWKRDKGIEWISKQETSAALPARRREELRPVVVGFGPAGMFAALTLAKAGWQPIVLERGQDVDTRQRDIQGFWQGGGLNPASNVQFGEGGAGTFSDGKLTTRIHDRQIESVLETFVKAGAPEEIRYLHKPHIGTDLLRQVVKRIREEIIRLGGEVRFGARVTDLELQQEHVSAVILNGEERIPAAAVFLGIGHSARDTYQMLYAKGILMEAKPFAVGVRIEHPQELIDRAQYGEDAGHPRLPVADYALTFQDREHGRGSYSFCMCPGGTVVAAASETGRVVTNGMSNYRRDSGIANSALLVTVTPEDFGPDVLDGIRFQQKYEAMAFQAAGRDYFAPVQSVGDFLQGRSGSLDFLVSPTYRPGTRAVDLHRCLPGFVTGTLEQALRQFDRKIPGFSAADVPLTGVEMRSSAPCRIRRKRETFESENLQGLYPIGEGAGYAGGIMSSAVDGMKAALAFLR